MGFGADKVMDTEWLVDEGVHLVLDREHRNATLVFDGDCDISSLAPTRRLVQQAAVAGVTDLAFDFTAVTFADTTAVRVALEVRDDLAGGAGCVSVYASASVKRIFELTNTTGLFAFRA